MRGMPLHSYSQTLSQEGPAAHNGLLDRKEASNATRKRSGRQRGTSDPPKEISLRKRQRMIVTKKPKVTQSKDDKKVSSRRTQDRKVIEETVIITKASQPQQGGSSMLDHLRSELQSKHEMLKRLMEELQGAKDDKERRGQLLKRVKVIQSAIDTTLKKTKELRQSNT
mmetsp:Transcript_5692/g.7927  ORF Transcript_5692/g.7927 Transcript_5692/m.7927 type:complete len:168 (-) Transcript_5692:83-586(-)